MEEMKKIEVYFEKARQIPLSVTLAEVQSLVQLKGINQPPIKKGWWNLNTFIIMSSTIVLSTLALLFFETSSPNYQTINRYSSRNYELSENSPNSKLNNNNVVFNEEFLDSTKKREGIIIEESKPLVEESGNSSKTSSKVEKKTNKEQNVFVFPPVPPEPPIPVNTQVEAIPPVPAVKSLSDLESIIESVEDELSLLAESIVNNVEQELSDLDDHLFDELEQFDDDELVQDVEEEDLSDYSKVNNARAGIVLTENSKKITRELSSEGINWFKIKNRYGNITIENWDQDMIEVIATVKMDGHTEEDLALGLEDFKLDLLKKGDQIYVDNNWKDYEYCTNWPKHKHKKKTEKGEKIRVDKVEIDYQIKLPRKMSLDLQNNYGDVNVGEVGGELKGNLFKGDLTAGKIDGDMDLKMRYGDAFIQGFETGNVDLFQSKVKLGTSKEFKIKANYSDVVWTKSEIIDLTAFKSDFESDGEFETIEGSLKYGDLLVSKAGKSIQLSTFKAKINTNQLDNLTLNSSYTRMEASGKIGSIELESAFQSEFDFQEITDLKGNIKYTPLRMELLNNSIDIVSFQGSVKITEVNKDFLKMKLVTKYTDVDLAFNPNAKYELEAETMYTDVDLPNKMNLSYENNASQRMDVRGTYNSESDRKSSTVYFNTFQGNLNLR